MGHRFEGGDTFAGVKPRSVLTLSKPRGFRQWG